MLCLDGLLDERPKKSHGLSRLYSATCDSLQKQLMMSLRDLIESQVPVVRLDVLEMRLYARRLPGV